MKTEQLKLFEDTDEEITYTNDKFVEIKFSVEYISPVKHTNLAIALIYKQIKSINSIEELIDQLTISDHELENETEKKDT